MICIYKTCGAFYMRLFSPCPSIHSSVRPSIHPIQGAVAIKMPDFLAGARVSRCREEGMTSVFRPVHCNIMGNEICNA